MYEKSFIYIRVLYKKRTHNHPPHERQLVVFKADEWLSCLISLRSTRNGHKAKNSLSKNKSLNARRIVRQFIVCKTY